jgi:hypothetical protein
VTEERAFIEQWWRRKFSMPNLPTDEDVIMFAHAIDLVTAYHKDGDGRSTTRCPARPWAEAWWQRKFPAKPLKWGSVLTLSDAEELLIEFREATKDQLKSAEQKKAKEQTRRDPARR